MIVSSRLPKCLVKSSICSCFYSLRNCPSLCTFSTDTGRLVLSGKAACTECLQIWRGGWYLSSSLCKTLVRISQHLARALVLSLDFWHVGMEEGQIKCSIVFVGCGTVGRAIKCSEGPLKVRMSGHLLWDLEFGLSVLCALFTSGCLNSLTEEQFHSLLSCSLLSWAFLFIL